MASKLNYRRWILLGLVALGVVVAATLPRRSSDEADSDSDTESAVQALVEGEPDAQPTATQDADGGLAEKRVVEGCDAVAEAQKYRGFVERKALAILSWSNMPERAANLRIPVYVNGVDAGAVAVSILPIPMRDQYLNIWMNSGHIERGPGDTFLLDPCSATIVDWAEMQDGD